MEPSLANDANEPLLIPDPTRYTMFPLKHHDLWKAYKNHMAAFWSEDEIDFSADKADWAKLTADEKYFIENILAFFAGADGVVNLNIVQNFAVLVQPSEAAAFYAFQSMIENVHCVSGDTRVLTHLGYIPIKNLVDRMLHVWTGTAWSNVKFRYTGMDELYRVTLKNGMELECTPDHRWFINGSADLVPTCKLKPGMSVQSFKYPFMHKRSFHQDNEDLLHLDNDECHLEYPFVHGYFCGHNLTHVTISTQLFIQKTEQQCIPLLTNSFEDIRQLSDRSVILDVARRLRDKAYMFVPVNANAFTKFMWFEALCNAAGVIHSLHEDPVASGEEFALVFPSIHLDFLRDVQLMLTTLQICSSIEQVTTNLYRLVIGHRDLKPFYTHQPLLSCRFHVHGNRPILTSLEQYTIVSVEPLEGAHPTFCFEEKGEHRGIFNGIMTSQSTVYSLLIDTFVEDPEHKNKLFNAIETIPCVAKKANWALKWMDDKSRPFAERLVAFIIVEGIFFSGSFCSIFWLKSKGLMTRALGLSNEFIARDESLHTDFGVLLYHKLRYKLSRERLLEIMCDAVDMECEFICDSLPCALIGMNSDLMTQYIKFVADRLLVQLGYSKFYFCENPFDFMTNIGLTGKTNFFEKRVTEYRNASATIEQSDKAAAFDVDADF